MREKKLWLILTFPTTTAAMAMGSTISRRPVPCEGSTMMGRCESFFTAATALRSRVFLV